MKRSLVLSGLFAAAGLGAMTAANLATADDAGWRPSHERFAAYVAEAQAVFGKVEIGASCNEWPERTLDEISKLTVLPATTEGKECTVIGWAYAAPFAVEGLPDDALVAEGQLVRPAYFDATGNVAGHFASPEAKAGSLTEEQMAELAEAEPWADGQG